MKIQVRIKKIKLIMLLMTIIILMAGKSEAATLTKKLGNEYVSMTIEENEEVTMKFTEKIGFKFKNWVVESGSIGNIDTTSKEISFYMPNSNVTIRANYYENYNVTFNNNGGSGSMAVLKVPTGSSKVIPQNTTMTKDGYFLKGWAEEENGDAVYFEGESIKPTEDMTLYAVWIREHPIILAGGNWYKGSVDKSTITKITFVDSVDEDTLTGLSETWNASDDAQIKGYLFTDNTVIVAGNGKGKIYANQDSKSMFADFSSVTAIEGLEILDTSDAINMRGMFYGCTNLTTLDLSNFNTKNATNMNRMFSYCSNLTELDISSFNASNVIDMNRMFAYATSLVELDLSNFKPSAATDLGHMFHTCTSLQTLKLTNFITSSATDMNRMFYDCNNLEELDITNFDTSDVTDMCCMFYGCNKLKELNLSSFETGKVIDMRSMFHNCSSLTTLDLKNFVTSKVTDMQRMFNGCISLTVLDLSDFDTISVTKMNEMFYGCTNLTNLNLSNFNTAQVTDMSYMFYGCTNLTNLNLSNFNTAQVTDMRSMFYGCSNLTELDLSSFNTSNVIAMNGLFMDCTSLVAIDVSNFDTSSVENMSYMFYTCPVETLDLSSFNTTNVTNMNRMFYSCNRLATLDISNFDATNVTNVEHMFAGCDYSEFTLYVRDEAQKSLIQSILYFPSTATVVVKDNIYLVIYNLLGGSGEISREEKTPGVNMTLSSNTPTKEGYTFVSWNTKIDGTGDTYMPGGTYDIDKNIVLYAIWAPIVY